MFKLFMAANSDVSATAHHIVELCEWRGERAYRPNQANGFNEEEIETPIEYLCLHDEPVGCVLTNEDVHNIYIQSLM